MPCQRMQAGALCAVVAALCWRPSAAVSVGHDVGHKAALEVDAAAAEEALAELSSSDQELDALAQVLGRSGKIAASGPRRERRMAAIAEATAAEREAERERLMRHEDERLQQAFDQWDPDSMLEDGDELYGGLESDGLEFLEVDADGDLVNFDEEPSARVADAQSLMEQHAAKFFEGAGERFLSWLQETWEDDENTTDPISREEASGHEAASLLETKAAEAVAPSGDNGAAAAATAVGEFDNGIAGQKGQVTNHVDGIYGIKNKAMEIANTMRNTGLVNGMAGVAPSSPAGIVPGMPPTGLQPDVALPAPVQQFKDGLAKSKDLWRKAKLTNTEIQSLKKMETALEPFKKCLMTLPGTESQYAPANLISTFNPVASDTPNFETLTKSVLTNYIDKLAPDVAAVMGELGTTKLSEVKAIVEGNLHSFTVQNACDPTWAEHTADQVHKLYTWILKQKGFGAAKCGEDYLVQNSYTSIKSVLMETVKKMLRKVCTYWKKIEPKAMTWIGREVGSFLIQRPQGYRFMAEESLVVAQKCFNRTQQQMSKVKGYVGNLKMRMVSAATFYNTGESLKSQFVQNKALLAEEEIVVSTAERVLRGWVKAFEPLVMSNVVHPVLSQGVNIINVIVSEVQSAIEGLFGMVPYAGGIMYNVVEQVIVGAQNFLSGKLVDIGMMSVANVFASLRKAENQGANLNFIAKMAAKAVDAATGTTGAAAAADQDIVGVSSGIKSHEDFMPDAHTLDVENAIFKSQPPSLKPLAAVVHVAMGLLKESLGRIKRRMVSCDELQKTLQKSFGAAKWNSDQSKWAPV